MKDILPIDILDDIPTIQHHVHLVKLDWLKPHEAIVSKAHVDALYDATLRWGAYIQPLLVDIKTGTILDGHHRYRVGQMLKLNLLPCILIDYLADVSISVEHWNGSSHGILEKQDIIEMALSPHVFPPKTSRHSLPSNSIWQITVPLQLLKQPVPFTGAYSNTPLKRGQENQVLAC